MMKKSFWCLTLVFLLLLSGCRAEQGGAAPGAPDVDLSSLNATMAYSELCHIKESADSYVGKTIRVRGRVVSYVDESSGKKYYTCVVTDATACCKQGIEFALKSGDYPADDAEITVSGVFESGFEEDRFYNRLANAELQN